MQYRRVAQLRSPEEFQTYLQSLNIEIPFDSHLESGNTSPLAQPMQANGMTIGNRFTVLPMEGWDGTTDGYPTDPVKRRWTHFGQSGAKLIWGGEAVAVRHDGRANPNQLVINAHTLKDIAGLRETLVAAHYERYSNTDDLMIGLQLTHSGRFARPKEKVRLESQILYHHPLLDKKFKLTDNAPLLTDDDISKLIADFVQAAVLVQKAGFHFVDIKHCHGYLGHEFLSAKDRPGRYGGSFENRTRFLKEIVAGIRAEAPELHIGVRLSAFDWLPFHPSETGEGEPEQWNQPVYPYTFGGDSSGTRIDLTEPNAFLDLLSSLDIQLVCITAGSPYYTPHIQRPALFPPSDGYLPPEDPLVGVARLIHVAAELKQRHPDLVFVGSGYSYLQDWLPLVAQCVVRTNRIDSVGLGRIVLSYPDMAADVLAGRPLQRKRICRTFSDCTTAPRGGLPSGCYPLDDYYKHNADAEKLAEFKAQSKLTVADSKA